MKPLITGSEMKLARNPSRRSPARHAAIPTATASAAVAAANAAASPGATTSATVAADSAAVADMGPTTRCRELPNAAYRSSAAGAAYKPTTGETPAIAA